VGMDKSLILIDRELHLNFNYLSDVYAGDSCGYGYKSYINR
jgi:hypothetical protein